MMDDRLKIRTGVGESEQERSFIATLQGVSDNISVSIAITLPDHMSDLAETTAPMEEIAAALREDFKHLTDIGYEVEIQIGPSREYEADDESE